MKVLATIAIALATAPAASASWTHPSVLLKGGDETMVLGGVVRPDGSLRTAFRQQGVGLGLLDAPASPLIALRAPTLIGQVAFAADGSGVALDYRTRALFAFDAAGAAQPALQNLGDEPTVAISPAGAAVAAWVAKTPQGYEIDAAFRDPGSPAFGPPVRAGYATNKRALVSAGIGDSGEAVVAWQTNGFPSDVAAAVRLPGAGFSPARFVARNAGDARLAVGPGGQAILAVQRGAGLDMAIKPPGADAMPATQRVDRGQGYAVNVAAAGPRTVATAWITTPSLRDHARVRLYEGTRRVGTLGRFVDSETLGLAVDTSGAMVVAWDEIRRHGDALAVAYRPSGSRPQPPTSLGAATLGSVQPPFVVYQRSSRVYVIERKP